MRHGGVEGAEEGARHQLGVPPRRIVERGARVRPQRREAGVRAPVVVQRPAGEAGHERPHRPHVVGERIVERVLAGEHAGAPIAEQLVRGEGVQMLLRPLDLQQVERQGDGGPNGHRRVRLPALEHSEGVDPLALQVVLAFQGGPGALEVLSRLLRQRHVA